MGNEFKVVKIIDEYNVVINAGISDQVNVDDKFTIMGPGEEIFDPETNESLGFLEAVKATVVVKQVFEKMCLCGSNEQFAFAGLSVGITAGLFTKPRLNIDYSDVTPIKHKSDDPIRVGDKVRKA